MADEHELNAFERKLLSELTAGGHPTLAVLRHQAAEAKVRNRLTSSFGIETELTVPPEIDPVMPSDFRLSDVAFSVGYGSAHCSASCGPPGEEELGQASLVVEGGYLAGLHAHLIFELWPVERATDGSAWYQPAPAFADGPYYVDADFNRVTNRDMDRLYGRFS